MKLYIPYRIKNEGWYDGPNLYSAHTTKQAALESLCDMIYEYLGLYDDPMRPDEFQQKIIDRTATLDDIQKGIDPWSECVYGIAEVDFDEPGA